MLTLSSILLAVQLRQLRDLVKINSNNYGRSKISTLVFQGCYPEGSGVIDADRAAWVRWPPKVPTNPELHSSSIVASTWAGSSNTSLGTQCWSHAAEFQWNSNVLENCKNKQTKKLWSQHFKDEKVILVPVSKNCFRSFPSWSVACDVSSSHHSELWEVCYCSRSCF